MDRISTLPDEILIHILSFLPTKNAVSTSILSFIFANLWTSLPVIDLKTYPPIPDSAKLDTLPFVNFVNNLLVVNTAPTIRKFRLRTKKFDDRYISRINGWIRLLFSTKNIVELDLNIVLSFSHAYDDDDDCISIRLPSCDSLEILKVSSNMGLAMALSDGCFRNLRVFHLIFDECELYRQLVATLFPNLPRLEELVIIAHVTGILNFNIDAPALKTFSMSIENVYCPENLTVEVVIDAPLLEHMSLDDHGIAFYYVKNLSSLSKVKVSIAECIWVDYYTSIYSYSSTYISQAVYLLRGLSDAKSLSLSGPTVLALVCSFQKNLPAFPLLTKLELFIPYSSCCILLLPLLANAPNLEVLIVALREFESAAWESSLVESEAALADSIGSFLFCPPKVLPTCLLHLQEIEFRGLEKKEEFKLSEYIVKNGKVLKKVSVNSVKRK